MRYEKYKDSGFDWIGEIPEGWEVKKLKYKINFITGFTPPSGRSEYYQNGQHTWVTITDIKNKYVENSARKITDKAIEDLKPTILPIGSLLYSFKLSVGKVAFNTKELYTNEAIFAIFPNENINLNFYYYSLPQQVIMNANENIYGAKILNQDLIKNVDLIIPPKPEQTAIANYLDRKTAEIDKLISQKEQLIELYEEEKTAIINQAVTGKDKACLVSSDVKLKDSGIDWIGEIPEHWEVKKLKYVVKLITEKSKGDYKKVGLENIESNSGSFIETNSEFQGAGIKFQIGDILYGKLRPYLSKVFLSDIEGAAVGDFFVLRPYEKYLSDFIKYLLLSSSFTEISNSSTYGSKMPRVSWEFMSHLFFALPKKEEQTAIVQYIETELNRINTKVEKTKKLIDLLGEYKQSLISEVVTGKIKVI